MADEVLWEVWVEFLEPDTDGGLLNRFGYWLWRRWGGRLRMRKKQRKVDGVGLASAWGQEITHDIGPGDCWQLRGMGTRIQQDFDTKV